MSGLKISPAITRECGACKEVYLSEGNSRRRVGHLADQFVILGLARGFVYRKYLCNSCYGKVCESLGLNKDGPWTESAEFRRDIDDDFDSDDYDGELDGDLDEEIEDWEDNEND